MTQYAITKVGNYGLINPVPEGILAKTLDKYMSYERPGKQFMSNPLWATVRLYKEKKGLFPWGLLHIANAVLKKYSEVKGLQYIPTLRNGTFGLNINISNLRPYQNDAINKLFINHGGVLNIPTGGGKTVTIIEYLKLINKKSLVIVPTLDIKRQWEEFKLINLDVSTYQNKKLIDKMKDYDVVVCDESHHVSSKTIYNLAMKTKTDAILVGISATNKREDGNDMKITAALGQIVYSIERKDLIKQGYLANAEVIYLKPKFSTNKGPRDYQTIYNEEIVNNIDRNNHIVITAINQASRHRKVFIIVSRIDHGQMLFDQINEWGDITKKVIFMNGQSKDRNIDLEPFDIIIATQIFDEGWNLPSLDTIILAAGGRSSIKLTQRIGRVLRIKSDGRSARIYDFVDSPKHLKSHYLKRRALLEKDFSIIEVDDINQSTLNSA